MDNYKLIKLQFAYAGSEDCPAAIKPPMALLKLLTRAFPFINA